MGVNLPVRWIPTGYSYDSSEACVDGQFVGLPLDESNESDQTDKRIDAWISGLKQVIC